MRLFDGVIDSSHTELLFIAPARGFVPSLGWRVRRDDRQYTRALNALQRLRGRTYLEDGAITEAQLTDDGRHWQAADAASWHLLALDGNGEVCGCARYSHYGPGVDFRHLGVRNSALAQSPEWGTALRLSVEQEISRARAQGVAFAEVGGWAVSDDRRFSCEALRIALSTFGLSQLLGGCVGITTATFRHHSSTILRRIGGRSLVLGESELPSYFDSQYGCQMEVLRFDSAKPASVYRRTIERLRDQLLSVTVVAPGVVSAVPYSTIRPVPTLEPLCPAV